MTETTMPYGVRLSMLNRAFKRQMDERFREHGLTGPQACVLGALHRLEEKGAGEIHQRDLELAVELSHATMNDILCRLEKKGYLVREPSRRDRRAKVIRPTELARALHEEVPRMDEAAAAVLTEGLTAEDLESFNRITDVMLRNARRRKEEREEAEDA